MAKHVEMIIDYTIDGTDYQYNDNHGVLIRCKDCKYFDKDNAFCEGRGWPMQLVPEDGYCYIAERKNDG